jgi:hypothetical protein
VGRPGRNPGRRALRRPIGGDGHDLRRVRGADGGQTGNAWRLLPPGRCGPAQPTYRQARRGERRRVLLSNVSVYAVVTLAKYGLSAVDLSKAMLFGAIRQQAP